MKKVLVVGGGLAGCVVARELSHAGIGSCILEKGSVLGGKAREYGCKATEICNNCGVCLTGSLWTETESNARVETLFHSRMIDLAREENGFSALIQREDGRACRSFTDVVIASGFDHLPQEDSGNLTITPSDRIISGHEVEKLLKSRKDQALFDTVPERVGFLLCFGSRNMLRGAPYCSKVCCAYSTRTAKVIRHLYPAVEVVMFYMDLQAVKPGQYAEELKADGISLVRCRPVTVGLEGNKPKVAWGESDGYREKTFDYLILCSGIRPGADSGILAELCELQVDKNGFLQYVRPPQKTGIWLAGTAAGPMTIAEVVADAKNTAAQIIQSASSEVLAV